MRTLKDKLTRDDFIAGAIVAMVVGLTFALMIADPMGCFAGLAAGAVAAQQRRRYLNALAARIDVGDGVTWDVAVNGIKVGAVSDADYARLRQSIFTDWRNYIAQLANLVWCASKVIDSMFVSIPLAAFWGSLAIFAVAPDQSMDALRQLQALPAKQIGAGVCSVVWILPMIAFLYVAVNVLVTGARFGFVNVFSERSADRLRRQLGVPTVGQVSLSRLQDGGYLFNDESKTLASRSFKIDNHKTEN